MSVLTTQQYQYLKNLAEYRISLGNNYFFHIYNNGNVLTCDCYFQSSDITYGSNVYTLNNARLLKLVNSSDGLGFTLSQNVTFTGTVTVNNSQTCFKNGTQRRYFDTDITSDSYYTQNISNTNVDLLEQVKNLKKDITDIKTDVSNLSIDIQPTDNTQLINVVNDVGIINLVIGIGVFLIFCYMWLDSWFGKSRGKNIS